MGFLRDRFTKKKIEKRTIILWTVRFLLVSSIVLNLIFLFPQLFADHVITEQELLDTVNKKIELVFLTLLTLVLSFLPDYLERRRKIQIPNILEIVIVLFIYAGIFLSVRFDLYYRFFWWDDLLHMLSGLIIGVIGFLLTYKINHKKSMNINPLFIAVFAFSFAMTIGVLWEMFEFTVDSFWGTAMQRWNLPENTYLVGRDYQGSGLRDTMSDLIIDGAGALITSTVGYFLYKNEKRKTIKAMKDIFQ